MEIRTGSSDSYSLNEESSSFDRVQRRSNESQYGKKKGINRFPVSRYARTGADINPFRTQARNTARGRMTQGCGQCVSPSVGRMTQGCGQCVSPSVDRTTHLCTRHLESFLLNVCGPGEKSLSTPVLMGADNAVFAIELEKQLISMLKSGGTEMRKCCSNEKILMEQVPYPDQ
ncbi:hypothetical protein TNCV_4975481 [Trichonephila clavipes]|uniref:Uncharacterized protein n=1 Tax=Trichonephila clavipes TaxID=2585209 RepID=A0A8X6SSA0_TRICX|nr:hypothetical protein TNCV_4975481 [Trichonephila clavipes]